MDNTKLPSQQDKRNLAVVDRSQEDKVSFVAEKFKVGEVIDHLYTMMQEVTKQDFNPATVSAACQCVSKINETMNTTINAARFLNQKG